MNRDSTSNDTYLNPCSKSAGSIDSIRDLASNVSLKVCMFVDCFKMGAVIDSEIYQFNNELFQ